MKLTLSSGGGFTGQTKESTIDIDSLDPDTRAALMHYLDSPPANAPANVNESWSIDDSKEAPIHTGKMNVELLRLYQEMQRNLSYIQH